MPISEPVQIRIASLADQDRVRAAYEALGYRRDLRLDNATVWIAESDDEIVGVVRIATEHKTLVLRGMRVAQAFQRKRIGARLLDSIADWLGDRECYCIPYSHLVSFYGRIDFVEITAESAPRFLAERLTEYKESGLSAILMRRG